MSGPRAQGRNVYRCIGCGNLAWWGAKRTTRRPLGWFLPANDKPSRLTLDACCPTCMQRDQGDPREEARNLGRLAQWVKDNQSSRKNG